LARAGGGGGAGGAADDQSLAPGKKRAWRVLVTTAFYSQRPCQGKRPTAEAPGFLPVLAGPWGDLGKSHEYSINMGSYARAAPGPSPGTRCRLRPAKPAAPGFAWRTATQSGLTRQLGKFKCAQLQQLTVTQRLPSVMPSSRQESAMVMARRPCSNQTATSSSGAYQNKLKQQRLRPKTAAHSPQSPRFPCSEQKNIGSSGRVFTVVLICVRRQGGSIQCHV